MSAQLLLVSVGGRRLGLDLDLVQEIVDRGTITSLPGLPAAVAGVIAVRGAAVPVIDAGALDGGVARYDRRGVVIGTDGVRPLALLVDEVEGIVEAGQEGDAQLLDLRLVLEELS